MLSLTRRDKGIFNSRRAVGKPGNDFFRQKIHEKSSHGVSGLAQFRKLPLFYCRKSAEKKCEITEHTTQRNGVPSIGANSLALPNLL